MSWPHFLTRLNLLFTLVAIGGRVRVADAWRDSRGHFWSGVCIVGTRNRSYISRSRSEGIVPSLQEMRTGFHCSVLFAAEATLA